MRLRAEHMFVIAAVFAVLLVSLYLLERRRKRLLAEGFSSNGNAPFVTFIIPSVGRDTIDMSLTSLQRQTNPNWRAIVVYDGVEDKSPTVTDSRISILRTKQGSAGATRNFGIQKVNTPWTAFLDDDDAISPNYVELLEATIDEEPNMDVLVFRMTRPGKAVEPESNRDFLTYYDVGIYFAAKTDILKKIKFKPIHAEDFYMLKDIVNQKYTVIVSEHMTYSVRPPFEKATSDDYWQSLQKAYRMERVRIRGTNGDPLDK